MLHYHTFHRTVSNIVLTAIFIGLLLFVFSSFTTAYAQVPGDPVPLTNCGRLGINCPDMTVNSAGETITLRILTVIQPLLLFAEIIAVLALLYGAFKYISSTGDEAEAKKAKQTIIYALVGLLVIGISGIAVNFFINVLSDQPIARPFWFF